MLESLNKNKHACAIFIFHLPTHSKLQYIVIMLSENTFKDFKQEEQFDIQSSHTVPLL